MHAARLWLNSDPSDGQIDYVLDCSKKQNYGTFRGQTSQVLHIDQPLAEQREIDPFTFLLTEGTGNLEPKIVRQAAKENLHFEYYSEQGIFGNKLVAIDLRFIYWRCEISNRPDNLK